MHHVTLEAADGKSPPVRAWIQNVPCTSEAKAQLAQVAALPIVRHSPAAMPDLHVGNGVTVGCVIPTTRAVIPAAVGVDIGCGMMAVRTSLTASDLPGSLEGVRLAIELAVPHGRTHGGNPTRDAGGWRDATPELVGRQWAERLEKRFRVVAAKRPSLERSNHVVHLGTLGGGNHFVELCLDEADRVWLMLHSGSRGVGNRIGQTFIEEAKKDMGQLLSRLPNKDLAYLREGTSVFDDYVEALEWAQDFARVNREIMMARSLQALRGSQGIPPFTTDDIAVNCHHNYVERAAIAAPTVEDARRTEQVWLTRKGATSAKQGELGIIPGSMGARSFIVRGKGSTASYCSCSHGAGRRVSRGEAKRMFTVEEHSAATEGIECRKDKGVLDETPMAYKDIDAVMEAQADLVDIVHTLRQLVCVKG